MHIVLVHGFLNRGGVMQALARHLGRQGHNCHTPSLRPADARRGLPDLAQKLNDYIELHVPASEEFVLIGFSMGAIVSRTYLRNSMGASRVVAFYSIAGPHGGTVSAWFYPSVGARQMRAGSPFLRELEKPAAGARTIPIVCYWTPFDLMIWPAKSARLPGAEHVRIPALVHSLLIFDPTLFRDLAKRIEALPKK